MLKLKILNYINVFCGYIKFLIIVFGSGFGDNYVILKLIGLWRKYLNIDVDFIEVNFYLYFKDL